jgi:trimeric autotransporter adhesin
MNTASGPAATVGGGDGNTASSVTDTVPGGSGNTASGGYSFAAGAQASATQIGSFVWSSYDPTVSWGDFTFTARAHGGTRFYSAAGTSTGVQLSSGGNSWGSISDRNAKANFSVVDNRWLLDQLAAMPIQTWNLKSQAAGMRHIGPVAQDFNGLLSPLFGTVEDPLRINNMDAVGVSLAAIQGLYQELKDRDAKIAMLESRLTELEQVLKQLAAGQKER